MCELYTYTPGLRRRGPPEQQAGAGPSGGAVKAVPGVARETAADNFLA